MSKSGLLSSLFGAQKEEQQEDAEQHAPENFEVQAKTTDYSEYDVLDSGFVEMTESSDTRAEQTFEIPDIEYEAPLPAPVVERASEVRSAEVRVTELPDYKMDDEDDAVDFRPSTSIGLESSSLAAGGFARETMAARPDPDIVAALTESDRETLSGEAMQKRREIHRIRADLKYFQVQLTQNELFASKARENLKQMAEFMQESELELSAFDQLSNENKENTSRILQLSEELEDVRTTLIEKNVELVAEQNRVSEIRDMLEEARGSNTELNERFNNATNEIRNINRVRNDLENEHNAITIRLNDAESSNRVFAETIDRQSKELSDYLDLKSELEKTVEEMQKQQSRLHVQRDRMGAELLEKAETIRSLKEDNLELRSSNESQRKEIESKQRHATSKLKSREDEIFALKSEIDTLHSQLSVRKQMFNQAQNETNSARAVAKVAKDSIAEVEARLVSSNLQREIEQKNLVASNNELAELSGRYKSLLKQLDRVTQENESLRHLQQFYGEQADRAAHAAISTEAKATSQPEDGDLSLDRKRSQH